MSQLIISLCSRYPFILVCLLCSISFSSQLEETSNAADHETSSTNRAATVFLAMLARNAAHLLPNYLGFLEKLNYPKSSMIVHIYTDHNQDNTSLLLNEWTSNARSLYHSVQLTEQNEWTYSTKEPFEWNNERIEQVCRLRQRSLEEARKLEAEYLFFVDTDNFLVNPNTLLRLIEAKKPIVAPMLIVDQEKAYSNYWAGQNEKGYYMRTDEYIPILTGKRKGCFKVPVVHSTLLIDLRTEASNNLVYWPLPEEYKWDTDDVLILSYSARKSGLGMYVLNTEFYGYLLKPWSYVSLGDATVDFMNWKLKTLVNYAPLPTSQFISPPQRSLHNSGLDEVYMINLLRRPERRNRMLECLNELAFDYTVFDAIDGKQLNETYIKSLGIKFLPGWKDPWGERPLTYGEIGCFLSHYMIWLKMIAQDMEKVLVLEDDIDFEPFFRRNLETVLKEVEEVDPDWDLVYVGRKSLNPDLEHFLKGAPHLVKPTYSYWTLGYILSIRGAQKFLAARPFDNLLPVDEYFPIMYNEHSEEDWIQYFPKRDLRAYSAEPLLLYPTHYVGDNDWFSDTEPPVEELEKIRRRKEQQMMMTNQEVMNEVTADTTEGQVKTEL